MSYVFGPVPSRRLGRSLGVDLVPFKTCTYDCIYCQLGRTTNKTLERREWVPTSEVVEQVKQKLPTRPDYISTRGLVFLRKFRQRNPEMGVAELLGVVVNMQDPQSSDDDQYDRWLRQNQENRCFKHSILRVTPLQAAAYYSPAPRSYWAKYPGQTGDGLRHLTDELLRRVAEAQQR